MDKDKYIYSNDLKYPLWIIAISMAIFIMFIAWAAGYSWIFQQDEDIRAKHLQQHHDEQVKYDRMIEVLEDIKANTRKRKESSEDPK